MAKSKKKKNKGGWLTDVLALVMKKPLVVLRFSEDEWQGIEGTASGLDKFTHIYSHDALHGVRTPALCLIYVSGEYSKEQAAYIAFLSSKQPVATLQSRLTIKHAHRITPPDETALAALITKKSLGAVLDKKLESDERAILLSPKLSAHLIEILAAIEENGAAMRSVIGTLTVPRKYEGSTSLQQDALNTALRAFGVPIGHRAGIVDIASGDETVLSRVGILEDAVIEDNARTISGMNLTASDLTGRAVFENNGERLEVITANKRPLEELLGVDLIYLNAIMENVVMVQYKMLEPSGDKRSNDWIYRPDAQFGKELARMKKFSLAKPAGDGEYRINPQVFYLKFVKRDAELGKAPITIPLEQFEILRKDPACKGPKGAFRVSYNALSGRYLRQEPFIDLIRAGYIGSHAQTTTDLATLIRATLKRGRGLVVAVQSKIDYSSDIE